MTRTRSKSIVQKIAADIPIFEEEHLNIEKQKKPGHESHDIEVSHPLIPKSRSKSFTIERTPETNASPLLLLYPFTNNEAEELWLNYINNYNYNCMIDEHHINSINNLHDDFILNFENNCSLNIESINELITENSQILNNLNSLIFQYDKISKGTLEFANQSTNLIIKQQNFESTINEIGQLLSIFLPLESITKDLSRPGNYLIKKQKFKDILTQLDNSISFLDKNPEFKQSDFYKIKFRQCLTRCLTLIRNYLIDNLKTLLDKIAKNLSTQKISTNDNLNYDILIYNEFSNFVEADESNNNFSNLINEIIARIPNHVEYKGLLDDVLQQFFKIRLSLLSNYIWENINSENLTKDNNDIVQFCQNNISFFKKVLEKEFILFKKFFNYNTLPTNQKQYLKFELYEYFKNLIDPLYDLIRQKIIRENNISNLCQLTILLQKYYEFEDDGSDIQSINSNSVIDSSNSIMNYGELFEPILSDVQSRIIFRIQIYVDEKLIKYKPKPEDLQIGHRKKSTNNSEVNPSSLDVDFEENLFPHLYLPLGKALSILSKIYELINSVVFDDLAHYIVHSCIYILRDGAYKLAITHLGTLDANLFYLKNLIILQNQLNNFDIQYVRTETTLDFTSGINEIYQIIRNGEFIYNINHTGRLIELVKKSVPKIINNMIDAKYEIELELNNAVNQFITDCANNIIKPILLTDSTSENPLQATYKFRDNLIIELPKIHNEIRLFIDDEIIIKFLIDNLSNLIISAYETFYNKIEEDLTSNKALEQHFDEIMATDTLINFVNDLVSRLYEEDETSHIEFNEDILNDIE